MGWIELRVVVARSRAERLGALAFELGALGTEEAAAPGEPVRFRQPWDTEAPPLSLRCTLRAWFDPEQAEGAREALQAAAGDAEVEVLPVEEDDWAESWKRHHRRIVISERLRVSPPWEAVPGDLIIPPGHAFGTGDHPTTLACLGAIDRLAGGGLRTCLDLGCGSGVLALAAASLGMQAEGIDIDPVSVETARENASINRLDARFTTTPVQSIHQTYDLVVANLFAEALASMAPDLLRVTGRHLVLAGLLADRAHLVLDKLSPPLAVRQQLVDGDWVSLHLERL